tara:strand:+ start:17531 stop:18985 length:1455 start_codon:yes stop_codon:yes gene_type:complete
MATSYLTRAVSSSGNQKTYTVSAWCKIGTLLTSRTIFSSDVEDDGANYGSLSIEGDGLIKFINMTSSSLVTNYQSNRKLFDVGSWYHIVLRVDTTQSTAGDRIRIYVNGDQLTSWAYSTTPNQDTDTGVFKSGNATLIGARHGSSSQNFWDGHLAHVHIVEGQSYAPTVFAEADSTTGEWKPILSPSVTYSADNSAFLKFENSAALGTDSSGQSNDFTVGGNLKQSVSTPSNLFCTLNAHESYYTGIATALKYAGTGWEDGQSTSDGFKGSAGTLACTKGKWYFEVKHIEGMYSTVGISLANSKASNEMINTTYRSPFIQGNEGDGFGFQAGTATRNIQRGDNTEVAWNDGSGSNIASVSGNDILMIAYDLDAGKIWWGKNGTWNTVPSSDTATSSSDIASGNNAHKTWTANGEFFRPAVAVYQRTYGSGGANPNTIQCNFGEGRFGTTAVASGNADSQGNGTFEYAPPTNYLAVCTKNIKDYG